MNERIRELAEQAGLRFTQLMSNPMVPVVDGKETDLEKFAELIVRECMGVNSTLLGHNTCKNLHNLYEEHFGVEE
jgi:hypothetical protein